MVYDLFYTSPSDDTPSRPHDRSRVSKRRCDSLTPEGTSTNRRARRRSTVDSRRSTVDGRRYPARPGLLRAERQDLQLREILAHMKSSRLASPRRPAAAYEARARTHKRRYFLPTIHIPGSVDRTAVNRVQRLYPDASPLYPNHLVLIVRFLRAYSRIHSRAVSASVLR